MGLKVGKDFHACGFISQISEPDCPYVCMFQGPTLSLRGRDGHRQSGTIALPGNDDCGETAEADCKLLNGAGDGARGTRSHEFKKLFAHVNLWYSGSVIEPVNDETVTPERNAVKRFAHLSGEPSRLISPIKKTRVAEEVADRIRMLMLDGTFLP